jgi:LmbE family N-acetylglucosaminyl deacetylase
MDPVALAARRYNETQASAKLAKITEYEVYDNHDCSLEPTLELRAKVTKTIREFCPDIVLTHRTCSYHADHRAIGQAVNDAAYLCTVPLYCRETPVPENLKPIFGYLYDTFTIPTPFSADAAIIVDDVEEEKAELLNCHESQFFEWLPYDRGFRDFDASNFTKEDRLNYIKENFMNSDIPIANECRNILEEMYGPIAKTVKRAEAYMLMERRNTITRQQFQEYFKIEK